MGPPASHRVSRVRWYSGFTLHFVHFAYRTFTSFGVSFQTASAIYAIRDECPQPQELLLSLASFPFARRYLGNRCFFHFLRVLRCFSSPRCLLSAYLIQLRIHAHYHMWVPPFGNLRINGYLLLPAAYRSLSRPSSAPSAKASALCSSSLDLSSAHYC